MGLANDGPASPQLKKYVAALDYETSQLGPKSSSLSHFWPDRFLSLVLLPTKLEPERTITLAD